MKNVLLLVHDDTGQEARLQCALDLTRALSGHLSCLDIVQLPTLVGSGLALADAQAAVIESAREIEAEHAAKVMARLKREDVSWEWRNGMGDIGPLLQDAAELADIVVLNTLLPEQMSPDMRAIVSDVVTSSDKPILAVPATATGFDASGEAVVAWNGSSPAAAAMRAATPLLALASGVKIVEIGENEGETAEEAASYLSRYDIHARIERPAQAELSVAETLLAYFQSHKPAYCVMGAYGHGRLRESLFGGVTRYLLQKAPIPLLMGH